MAGHPVITLCFRCPMARFPHITCARRRPIPVNMHISTVPYCPFISDPYIVWMWHHRPFLYNGSRPLFYIYPGLCVCCCSRTKKNKHCKQVFEQMLLHNDCFNTYNVCLSKHVNGAERIDQP